MQRHSLEDLISHVYDCLRDEDPLDFVGTEALAPSLIIPLPAWLRRQWEQRCRGRDDADGPS